MNKGPLIEHCTPFVRSYLMGRGCTNENLDDVMGDATLKALKGVFDEKASFRTWFLKIALNTWIDLKRKRGAKPFCEMPDLMLDTAVHPDWGTLEPSTQGALRQATDLELDAIGALYEHGNHRDAAKALGVTQPSFNNRIYRFRRKIGAVRPYFE